MSTTSSATTPPRRCRGARCTEHLPEWLPRATEFSDDRDLVDPVWIVEQVQHFPDVLDELLEETDLEAHYGRKRIEGKWALVMLAFVLSGHVDVQPFCGAYRSSRIWQLAGFKAMPSEQTVWARMTELEPHARAFIKAANKLIGRAICHEPRIVENVWVDATGFETHATLEHCCESKAECQAAGGGKAPKFIHRAGEELIKAERHRETEEKPADQVEDIAQGAASEVGSRGPLHEMKPPRRRRPYRYFMVGKHRYRSLDPDAGARSYRNGRAWFGGYSQAAVSMFAGAPLAINIFSADQNEHTQWPELLERMLAATGGVRPKAAVFDRGYSIESVFEHNTSRGIGSVMPFRAPNHKVKRDDLSTEKVDMHGAPRCKYCGGPGDQTGPGLGFYMDRGKTPRVRFRCELRITPECGKQQSIACRESWRLLLPVSRFGERYHALKKAADNKERNWHHWRARYTVAGASIDSRPKRPGLAWQELRASVALFLEWFRLSLRHGWLGSHRRRNREQPMPINRPRGPCAGCSTSAGSWDSTSPTARRRFAQAWPFPAPARRGQTDRLASRSTEPIFF